MYGPHGDNPNTHCVLVPVGVQWFSVSLNVVAYFNFNDRNKQICYIGAYNKIKHYVLYISVVGAILDQTILRRLGPELHFTIH